MVAISSLIRAWSNLKQNLKRGGLAKLDAYWRIAVVTLGILWILDGLLQLQPYNYSRDFVSEVLQRNAMGAPNFFTPIVVHLTLLFYGNTLRQIIFNTASSLLQLAIGIALVINYRVRIALLISILWSGVIWVVGEGFGQMPWPQASMALSGAPGPALIYALIALILMRGKNKIINLDELSLARASFLGGAFFEIAWSVIFVGTALLEFEPGNRSPDAISANLSNLAATQPFILREIISFSAHVSENKGLYIAFGLCCLQFWIGWAILRRQTMRLGLQLGIALSIVYGIVGQALGGIFTGSSTDPGLALPMVVFALLLYPLDLTPKPKLRKELKVKEPPPPEDLPSYATL